MRSFQLLRLAIEAEGLRMRHQMRRTMSVLGFVCIAALLALGGVCFGHVAAWYWLREYMAGQYVALIFAGVDLFIAAILLTLASRSTPGPLEAQALEVRRRALQDAAGSLSVMAMMIRALEVLMASRSRRK